MKETIKPQRPLTKEQVEKLRKLNQPKKEMDYAEWDRVCKELEGAIAQAHLTIKINEPMLKAAKEERAKFPKKDTLKEILGN